MLIRMMGRLKGAERNGNRGKQLKYYQAKAWLLSCLAHVHEVTRAEKLRMQSQVEEAYEELSEDDESPHHRFDGDMSHNEIVAYAKDFKAYISLFEHNTYEAACDVMWHIGQAFREARPAARNASRSSGSSSVSMQETDEQRLQRYNWSSQGEVSDPDLWATIHYGHEDAPMVGADGQPLEEF